MLEISDQNLVKFLLQFQLLNLSAEEIMGLYDKDEFFKSWLVGIIDLMQNEPAFFLLEDDILNKIEEVNNQLRFKYPDQESRDLGNIIIKITAYMRGLDRETCDINIHDYFVWQMALRSYVPTVKNKIFLSEMKNLISFDYATYDSLESRNYDGLFQERGFLGTTNNFLKTWPELYQAHPKFLAVTEEIVRDSLSSDYKKPDEKQYKLMAKNTLRTISKFKRSQ